MLLQVVRLKRALTTFGLSTKGKKAELVERLQEVSTARMRFDALPLSAHVLHTA